MEKRYSFGGFSFGSSGLFQLTIASVSPVGYGGTHGVELGLELSPEERQELITLLITINKKEDN